MNYSIIILKSDILTNRKKIGGKMYCFSEVVRK